MKRRAEARSDMTAAELVSAVDAAGLMYGHRRELRRWLESRGLTPLDLLHARRTVAWPERRERLKALIRADERRI